MARLRVIRKSEELNQFVYSVGSFQLVGKLLLFSFYHELIIYSGIGHITTDERDYLKERVLLYTT